MAHTDGHRGASGKHCPDSQNGGCVYCKTGEHKRPLRRKDRRAAKVELVRIMRDEV